MSVETLVPEGLTALPKVDPDAADLTRTLCALFGDAGLGASVVHKLPTGLWFAAAAGVRFQIAACEGHAPLLAADRVGDAVALLDAVDPLLTTVETALAVSLEPEALGAEISDNSVMISVACDEARITLAVPVAHRERIAWQSRAQSLRSRLGTMPCVVQIRIAGPRLSVVEAGKLADGDLVLIGAHVAATLAASDGREMPGVFDLPTGHFTSNPQGAPMAKSDPLEGPPDFAVPLTIRLPDRMTSAASLAALSAGTTLPLGPLTEGMPVELLVADRLLARGELVQLGERFAVLIESRAAIDDAVAQPADEEDAAA